MLLKKGADPFVSGEHSGTIRDVAISNNHTNIVEYLDRTYISWECIRLHVTEYNLISMSSWH
jgi:hypothetical protein